MLFYNRYLLGVKIRLSLAIAIAIEGGGDWGWEALLFGQKVIFAYFNFYNYDKGNFLNVMEVSLLTLYLAIGGFHVTSRRPCWLTPTKEF